MKDYSNIKNPRYFYSNLTQINTFYLFFLIIITLGFYFIDWLYTNNKVFEILDSDAPDKERTFFVIFLIPVTWFLVNYFAKILGLLNNAVRITSYIGWFLIVVLIIKYLYDFTASFGKITETYGTFWFLVVLIPFLIGTLLMTLLSVKTSLPFILCYLIFLIISSVGVLALQAEINLLIDKIHLKKETNLFYSE